MAFHNNIIAGAAGQAGGAAEYEIERSLRFNSGDSAYLSKTPGSNGSQTTATWSFWVKRAAFGAETTLFGYGATAANTGMIQFNGADRLQVYWVKNSAAQINYQTDQVFRDTSAWYHIVVRVDTTNATSVKIWVNGAEVSDWAATPTNATVNDTLIFSNTSYANYIGRWRGDTNPDTNAYLADVHFIDGKALAATDFGEFDATTGVWNPIEYTGVYNIAASGTQYSTSSTMANASAVFDGNTSNYGSNAMNSGSYQTVTTEPITFTLNNGTFTYTTNNCGSTGGTNYRYLRLTRQSDGTTTELSENSCNGWLIPNAWTGITISKIEWKRWSSSENVSAVYVDGTMLVDTGSPAGVNGFHLDFSDNSANAALGFDARVTGARYSAFVTGFQSSNPPANMFDGSTSTYTLGANSGGIMAFTPATAISYTASSGGVEVYFHNTSQPDRVRINGGSWYNQQNSSGGWETVSTGDGSITSMEFQDNGNNAEAVIYAIRVNGTILTDPSGANDWTVNNLDAGVSLTSNSTVWTSSDTAWTIAAGGGSATMTGSGYADVFSGLLQTNTVYAFKTSWTGGDNNGGWWFGDSNSLSLSGTHPNQGRGNNSIGQRGGTTSLGVHGTFASPNGVSAGDAALTGFSDTDPNGTKSFTWVVDRQNHKVWVSNDGGSSWVKGGDPSNTSSTPSFSLPSTGDIYFGFVQYSQMTTAATIAAYDSSTGTDSFTDSPINGDATADTGAGGEVSSNYCTWNPLDKGTVTLANGNLDITAASTDHSVKGTIAVPESVKIYYEFTVTQRGGGGAQSPIVGVANTSFDLYTNPDAQTSTLWAYTGSGAKLGGGSTYTNYGSSLSAGDVIGVAIDRSSGRIWFSHNGTWQNSGDPTSSTDTNAAFTNVPTTGTLFIFFGNNNGTPGLGVLNAGQRGFAYSAPTDYKALCTSNLPTPTIADGSTAFDVVTYASDGTSRTISGLNMSPDLVWSKRRSASARHVMSDSVRGVNKEIFPNLTDGERTSTDGLTAFNSDGYTLGADASQYGWQSNNNTFVNWAWDAGSSTVSNTDGSITSSVRANPSAGFSIVTWTGTGSAGTVGHGLQKKPELIIAKVYSANYSDNWPVYHSAAGATKYLYLNSDIAATTYNGFWNDTEPTSSVFSVGTANSDNTKNLVAYCFTSVADYSAIGQYTTGGSNYPFLHLGFRPRFLLYKYSSTTGSWAIFDTERSPYNVADKYLLANASDAEATQSIWDIVSNGLKPQTALPAGNTLIYAAFAEHPFKIARAR